MKRLSFLLLVLLTSSFSQRAFAQIELGAGLALVAPSGSFSSVAGAGFGVNLQGRYLLNDKMRLGLNTGYWSFGEKVVALNATASNPRENAYSASAVPLIGTFEYSFDLGQFDPYLIGQVGVLFVSSEFTYREYKNNVLDFQSTTKASSSEAGIGLGGGVRVALSDKFDLDASFVLGLYGDARVVPFNIGFMYKLGK